jgi:hypothetical protein
MLRVSPFVVVVYRKPNRATNSLNIFVVTSTNFMQTKKSNALGCIAFSFVFVSK